MDIPIDADLIVHGKLVGSVTTRYQYQTWGGTRSPERRLTSNLGNLRNQAVGGDIVLFARDDENSQRMVITLLKAGSPEHAKIIGNNPTRRWGFVPGIETPISNKDLRDAEISIRKLAEGELNLFNDNRPLIESTQIRKARNTAFRRLLISHYGNACQITNEKLQSEKGAINIDAAHIVPVEKGGSDDIRNGILLGKDIHWAFDRGLLGFTNTFQVKVKPSAVAASHSSLLTAIEGSTLRFGVSGLRPSLEAIAWHRDYWEI